jgi:hypothetical protein
MGCRLAHWFLSLSGPLGYVGIWFWSAGNRLSGTDDGVEEPSGYARADVHSWQGSKY